jgi:hypothetical protein
MRSLFPSLRTLTLAAAVSLGTTAARADLILPTAPGTTWNYDVVEGGATPGKSSKTVRIAGTESVSGKELLKLETRVGDEITRTELIEVNEQGIHCHSRTVGDGPAVTFQPPQTLIPAPLTADATWELRDVVAGTEMLQQFRVVGEEQVVVPAGTFRAFHFRCEQPWPISMVVERWFVPGVGLVKDVTTTRGPTGRLLSRVTTALKTLPAATSEPIAKAPPKAAAQPSVEIGTAAGAAGAAGERATSEPPAPSVQVEVAAERDGSMQTEFRSDAANIFVKWSGENLPVGADVRVAWIAEDVGDIADPNFIVDETETTVTAPDSSARFTLSRPQDGWAAGKYRVELYLDDELLDTVNVTIRD